MSDNGFQSVKSNPDVRPNAEERSDVPRDQYGRYLSKIPGTEHMNSVPAIGHTRVSTVTSALIQKKSLNIWHDRMILSGLASLTDDEVQAMVKAARQAAQADNKKQLSALANDLFYRGGGKTKSELGTAMHDFTERRNRGEALTENDMPEEHRPSLRAYDQVLADAGVLTIPEYLERRVWCEYGVQGTLDNVVWMRNDRIQPDGFDDDGDEPVPGELEMRVADLKTGRDLSEGWPEKLIQLWLYANARFMWEPNGKASFSGTPGADETMVEGGRWVPMPVGLRKDRALIIHVPMDGTAHLYDVDLSGVGEAVERAMYARRFEAEAPSRAHLISSVDMRGPAYVAPQMAPGSAANSVGKGRRVHLIPSADAPTVDQFKDAILTGVQDGLIQADQIQPNEEPAQAEIPLAGDGTPLQPLAGPGKRGCGVCGRTGHKRGSVKCLGENDPSTGRQAQAENQKKTGEQVRAEDPGAAAQYHDPAVCSRNAGWVPGPDGPGGKWVCGDCGLPSPPVPTTVAEAAKLSYPTATVTPWPSDWVLEDIRRAETRQAVLNVRSLALSKGAWNPEVHDSIGKSRYEELAATEGQTR